MRISPKSISMASAIRNNVSNVTAPNGQIQLYWDLTDGHGNQISFGNIQSVCTIHPPVNLNGVRPNDAPSSTPVHYWFLKDLDSLWKNIFSIAWGWNYYTFSFNSYREELMDDGVINILGNPFVDSYFLLPAANIPLGGSSFRYDSESDKDILMHALSVSGNFFWFGHGDHENIGGNLLKSGITVGDVENLLQNKAFRSTPQHPYNNKHPYYLAILLLPSAWFGFLGWENVAYRFMDYSFGR